MAEAQICSPAFIYLCFSLTQITVDTVKEEYNKAFFKFLIMIIFTLLLNNLCMRGLGTVSWIIVFVPFMLMSTVTAILLYVFGFDPRTGKLKNYTPENEKRVELDVREKAALINNEQQFNPEAINGSNTIVSQTTKHTKPLQTNDLHSKDPIIKYVADPTKPVQSNDELKSRISCAHLSV